MTDQVAQDLAKAVAAVVQGTHEITSVTIKPKREWHGLTDEERMELAIKTGAMTADWLPFMEAVEAKLKEKNT
jgi:hypothetical protein